MPLSNAERQRRHRERVKARLSETGIAALRAENERLRNEVERLQAENEALRNSMQETGDLHAAWNDATPEARHRFVSIIREEETKRAAEALNMFFGGGDRGAPP